MGKYEANGRAAGQVEFVHDGHEVVAVGAEAMKPDDGSSWIRAGVELDRFKRR